MISVSPQLRFRHFLHYETFFRGSMQDAEGFLWVVLNHMQRNNITSHTIPGAPMGRFTAIREPCMPRMPLISDIFLTEETSPSLFGEIGQLGYAGPKCRASDTRPGLGKAPLACLFFCFQTRISKMCTCNGKYWLMCRILSVVLQRA